MPQDSAAVPGVNRPNFTPLDVIRAFVLIVALFSLGLWGFVSWPLPMNVVIGLGLPVVVLLVWALFLSPKPMLRLHPYLRAAVELLIYVGVTLAWWAMGQGWAGIAFAVVAVGAGLITGRRALS